MVKTERMSWKLLPNSGATKYLWKIDKRLYEILSPEQGLDSIVLYNKLPTELVGRDTVIISGAILNNALGLSMDDTLGPYTIGEIYECMNSIDIEGDEYLAYHKNIIYIYIKYLEIVRPQNIFLVDPISKTFYQKDLKTFIRTKSHTQRIPKFLNVNKTKTKK